ncbi:allophanate hydrolase [Marinobacter sp. F3R11]|uniref:allophanate hydrolase n=1 Tax=Marinobacter sp. F3R11 TaxID=2267231 RepID=UPI000DEA1407|nr:allophanate hydrolase [Marinobacter sp. F3R11]RBW48798.1 allophanate hydrolase [Marinobacter sp. F3R11]
MNQRITPPVRLDIDHLQHLYSSGDITPRALLAKLDDYQEAFRDRNIWIHYLTPDEREPFLQFLDGKAPESLPLYGVPFAIKDNIHLKGIPTTVANRHVNILPEDSAFVVRQLLAAGAIPVGKTNLDQFATGLNGTRSDFGPCGNAFDGDWISGGSSAGSSVAVALGMVSFALGTDTAGSGRVPAALNHIAGLKPTLGRLSVEGVVPACQTLDCVSIFARTMVQANQVLTLADTYNPDDPWQKKRQPPSRLISDSFTFGIPAADQLGLVEYPEAQGLFEATIAHLEALGGRAKEIDFRPFEEAAYLLYEGPWVNERQLAINDLIDNPEMINPVVRDVVANGDKHSASDAFRAQYRLAALKQEADRILASVDLIVTPTCPGPYTIADMIADPIALNARLGAFTNFMNLLDYAAVSVPSGFLANNMPWGVTLFGPAWSDTVLSSLANGLHQRVTDTVGATTDPLPKESLPGIPNTLDVAVCGAHLQGYPLNSQLTERGAVLVRQTRTAPHYRFYALAGGPPYRPGLIRSEGTGGSIEVEVWRMPEDRFGTFVAGIPHPLGIGQLELEDGTWCTGFICEPCGIEGATDISETEGWRQYMSRLSTPPSKETSND